MQQQPNLAQRMSQVERDERVMNVSRVWRSEFVIWSKIYEMMEKGYLWLAGKQYTDVELSWYESQRRPANVFNLIFPHVNTFMGDFLESDREDRVFPVGKADPMMSETMQDMLTGIRQDNDDENTMTEVLLAALVKMGWIYTRFSNSRKDEGEVISSAVDEFEMLFDSRAKDYYIDDAGYLQRHRWMLTEQILNNPRWRHLKGEIKQVLIDKDESKYWEGLNEDTSMMMTNPDLADEHNGKYRIIEHHEKRFELTEVAYNPATRQSMIWDLEGAKADNFFKHNPDFRIIERKEEIKYISTVIPGLNMLFDEKRAELQDRTWDYTPLFAYHYGMKTIDNFGIFQNSFGPQKEFNEWHNRTADIINKTANPGIITKPAFIENNREVQNYGSMPGLNVQLKASATGDPEQYFKQRQINEMHTGTNEMQREALDLLPKILGISPNQQGFSESKSEPAALFEGRVRQAAKAMGVIYKNISKTKKRKGDKELANMQRHYTSHRTAQVFIKSTGSFKDLEVNIPYGDRIIHDITVGKWQVYVNDENRNPAMRELRFQAKLKLAFEYIAQLYGPQAIDPTWLFEDADLGDMREQIDRINAAIEGMVVTGQEQEAMVAADTFLEMANKRVGNPQGGASTSKQTAGRPQGPAN